MSRLRTEIKETLVIDLEPGLTIPLGLLNALCNEEYGVDIRDLALRGRLLEGFYIIWLNNRNTGTLKLHAIAAEVWKEMGNQGSNNG
jgi:hypothetical protein